MELSKDTLTMLQQMQENAADYEHYLLRAITSASYYIEDERERENAITELCYYARLLFTIEKDPDTL